MENIHGIIYIKKNCYDYSLKNNFTFFFKLLSRQFQLFLPPTPLQTLLIIFFYKLKVGT